MAFTVKKRKYVEGKLAGKSPEQAAIDAGYPLDALRQSIFRLERDPEVVTAMIRVGCKTAHTEQEVVSSDPIEFLESIITNPMEDPKLRADCAKALLPYKYARVGEKGKKEERAEEAEQVAKGKFAAGKPPALRSVN